MEKFYIFRKLAQEVKQFAAIALIVLLAVGNAFAEYDGTGTFTKINSADELTTGYYVVTNQTGEFALKNEAASNYIYRSNAEFVNPSSDIVWYVNVAADGSITLFNEEAGVYVEYHGNATSGSNYAYLVTELSDNCRWTPTLMDAGWDLANAVKNFRHLSYNPSNNGLRFACYANMGQQRLAFYKRGEAETPVVEAPVFTPGTGTYYTEQMVSLSCATTGANVYYAINGGDLILYNAPFTINANAHVSACAIIGEDTSAVTTVNYTFPVFINNIAAYYAAENADLFKITGDLTFVYRNGRYVYVKDETGGLLVYDNASVITTEYNEGDVFAGGLVGTRSMYHGLDEFEPVLNTAEGISGDEVAPVVVSAAQLLANPQNYVSQLVMVVDGEFAAGSFNTNTATKINFTQDGSTIKVRNAFKTVSRTFDAGDVATVIGFVTIYDNEVQLFPRDNADIITTALPVSCNFADNSTMLWTLVNGESASKWHIGAPQGFDDNKLYISSSNGLTNKYNVSVACDVHAYMDVTLPASDVLLTFDVRSMGDANDFLQVSVMDESPEAGSLPTEYLARFYGVNEFTTQTILIPASYAGDKKLVFTWHNDASGGTQAPAVIDNVVLKNTCAMVSNIEAEVEGRSATITWDAPEGQNSWTLQYRIVGAEDWQTVNASTAAVTLDHLTTDIVYDVRVRSNCGESASYWATYQFAVPCINWSTAQEEIAIGTGTSSSYLSPFNNFYRNSATQMMYPADQFPTAGYINSISWEMVGNSSHNYSDLKIYLGTSSSYTNSAWMPEENMTLVYHETDGTLGGGSAGWVEFPLDNPYYYNGEGNLVILVTRAASSYNNSLTYRYTTVSNSVRYRRDDNNASFADYPAVDAANSNTSTDLPNIKLDFTGFVCDDALCKAPKNLTAEVHAHTVNVSWLPVEGVSNYEVHVTGGDNMDFTLNVQNASQTNITGLVEGAQYTIGVKAVCGEGNASKYTTVDFTMPTICPAPTGLAVQEVGENSATITWNAGDASAWTVECGPAGFTLGTGTTVNVTSPTYTLTGLEEATEYDVYVRADCGADGVSNWFGPYTFTTAIDCEQFCNYTLELSDSYGDGWDEARVTVTYNGESTTYTIDDGEFESFPIQICDQTSAVFAYSIGSYASENSLELKDANGNVVWSHGGVNGNASQIITANCGTPVVEDCVLPENLAVAEYTSTSATLTWDGDAATQYEVSYYTATNDWVVSTVTGTTITLTGLSENQVYFARVRALCDEANTYSNEASFFTTNAGSACDDHTVSSQSGSNYYTPVNSYYKYSHSEQIYTPDEVGAAGNITKISFNYAHTATMTKKNNVTISLGHTTKSTLSASDSWTTTGLTQVYQGSLNCSNGWNEFVLDTEFPYNGTDNLVVVVNDMSNGYDGSAYKFYYTNTSSNMCLTYQSDGSAWSSSSDKTVRSHRPDIRFNVCTAATDIALLAVQDMTNACDLSNTTVAVNVKNTGSSNVTAFKLYYNVNGGAVVQENVALSEPLEPGATMTCTFSQHANMTDASNIVKAWVEMVGDGNNNNNVVFSNPVEVIEPASIPFTETFAAAEMHDGWSMVAPNNAPSFVIADNALRYNAGDESAAEAVATSPCLDMSDDGNYILTYDYKANSSYYNEQFSMFLTPSADANEDNVRPIVTKVFNNTEYVHAVERVSFWPWMDYNYDVNYLNIKAESGVGTEGFTIDNIHLVKALPLGIFTPDQHGTVQILTDNILNLYIDASASTYLIPENEDITLAISAQPGYHVQGIYSGALDDMVLLRGENPDNAALDFFTFTGGQHTVITVLFAPNNYNVDATVNNLYVTPYNNNAPGATYAPNHEVVAHGGNHTGVITIADHYSLESVAVNGMDVTSDLVALGENQYQLTLTNIWEDKDIQAVTVLDSAVITYTVLGGQGTINGTYVVDAATELPAIYTVTLPAYADLLSTIAPAPGFHVASIVIDGVEHTNISAYSFERLLGNHTVEVMFARNNYTITTVGYGNGTVSEGVAFLYNPDYTYTFEATPDAGYRIGSITRNNVALTVDNPAVGYTETLTNIVDNYDYEVMFVQNTYAITATAGNNGTVSPAGTSYYNYHQNADYDIVAALGYYIASVTVDGVTSSYTQTDNMTSTTYTFNAVDADHSISATFAPKAYTVTVDAGSHGTITPSTASYAFGSMPTFTIIPDAGYVIMDVMVDGVSLGSVATYTFPALTADHTIAATFGASQYTITATAGNGGSITPDGVTSMAYNGTQAYTISANAGYHVSNVFVDGASVGAVTSYTFANVTADHTIYAAFEANEYTVTVNQPANGTITPGTMAVQYGATPAFVITPDAGYNVTAITVNGSNVMSSATQENGIYTYTFPAINANQTINATMTAKTYTINASAGANGSITPSGSTTVNFGATQLYTIVPSAGYVVDNVTVDGIAMGALTSYVFTNVTASHTISATFKTAECEVPAFMYTSHIDSVSAMLHWSHPTATSFDIQYKTLTGSLANVSNVTGNSYQLTDLNPSTTYLWQVRANCTGSNHSDWSNLVAFTTEATLDITGVEDLVKDEIKVYGEHQNVHILNNGGVNIDNVRIFDAYGRMVYSGSVGTSHEVINLNVATGAYVVSVVTDKGVANYKVTIMK